MKMQEYLRLMQKIDGRYLDEAYRRTAKPLGKQGKWRSIMGKSLKIAVSAAICIAAVAGTVFAVNRFRSHSDTPASESSIFAGNAARFSDINTDKPEFEQFSAPAFSDKGYYYLGNPRDGSAVTGICYVDRLTGRTVYLCAKPECLHDGSDFCPATNADYKIHNLIWYDGILYAAATKQTHDKENPSQAVLLAYQPDGSGMDELTVLDSRGSLSFSELIAYRGELWVSGTVRLPNHTGESVLEDRPLNAEIWRYDLNRKKLSTVSCTETAYAAAFVNLHADSDAVYLSKRTNDPQGLKEGIYRISVSDGTMQRMNILPRDAISFFAAGGQLYWFTAVNAQSQTVQMNWMQSDEKRSVDVPKGDLYLSDGAHLFIESGTEQHKRLTVCDMTGKVLKTADFEPEMRDGLFPQGYSFACADGMLYCIEEVSVSRFAEQDPAAGQVVRHYTAVRLEDWLKGRADFAPLFEAWRSEGDTDG